LVMAAPYCTLMFARLATSVHLLISLSMNVANSCGVLPPHEDSPRSLSTFCIVGDPSTDIKALLTLSATSSGTPAGASTPTQEPPTKPGTPASSMVGTSGKTSERVLWA